MAADREGRRRGSALLGLMLLARPAHLMCNPSTPSMPRVSLSVCTDSLCESLGSAAVVQQLRVNPIGISVTSCGCLGRCGTRVQVCIEDLDTGGCELCDGVDETRSALRTYGYSLPP